VRRGLLGFTFLAGLILASPAWAAESPRLISYPTDDGGTIQGDLYGSGDRSVVLAHGAVFNKESWGDQAKVLVREGFRVLAIDFRGYGRSVGPDARALDEDILGAIRYLKSQGATSVSVIGASLGANAAALAAIRSPKGDIDCLILLAPPGVPRASEIKAERIAFIVSRGDENYRGVVAAFEKAPEPKTLDVLDGGDHAQHIFRSAEGEKLMSLIIGALR